MEEEFDERYEKLGFKPQRENTYNKLLPYADKLDEESNRLFYDIKFNLIKAVKARELRPGCAIWTTRLNKYMKIYGFKFSKEDHLCLIHLYYELVTIPNLEPTRINKFGGTLAFLLKKVDLISQDDLQLEWRPLHALCVRVMEKSNMNIGMFRYYCSLDNVIDTLLRSARVYFPVTATQEILDEFRPKLCPHTNASISSALDYMEPLLPIVVKPKQAALGYDLWFKEFMTLWEVCNNAHTWENRMATLMSNLALHNIGYIDWEPYIPLMFVRFQRALQLPVGYRQRLSGRPFKIPISTMTSWIVAAMGGPTDTIFIYLEKFMQTLETYFYSANSGRWTIKIRDFLKRISGDFINRVHYERVKVPSWIDNIPKSHLLTEADIDRFVMIMKPCLEHSVYSRQYQDMNLSFNYLATLRPNIIIPILLDKLYASMDSLTEPHKLTSAMMSITSASRYMVQGGRVNYPEGPTHVIPLMMNLLPGIDANDLRKCFMTFNFIVQFVNMIPLVDSSDAHLHHQLTEEEEIIVGATATFEDFVLQLFDRLCMWVESSSLEITRMEAPDTDTSKSKLENISESALVAVITTVLTQCSPIIFTAALKKMYNYATTHIFELKISGKMISLMCQAFGKVNPKETSKLFIPHLCLTIETLLIESENILIDENVEQEFLYNLLLLSEVVDVNSELIHYKDRLMNILDKCLYMTCIRGNQLASRMLNIMMTSLTFISPTEYKSSTKSFDSDIKENLLIRDWGKPADLDNLDIKWYLPGVDEIDFVHTLLNKYLVPALDTLNKYAEGDIILERDSLRRTLRIVLASLGCHTVLPLWKEPALILNDSILDPWSFELMVAGAKTVYMPDGRNVRKVVTDTILKVQQKLLELDEGDTKSLLSIITIYDVLLFNKFRGRDFEQHWKNYHALKHLMGDKMVKRKQHLRHIVIDRVMLHQEIRNESRSCTFTETHKDILLGLFELSVSRYGVVRQLAQIRLFNCISTYSFSYTILTPHIKKILQLDTTEHHEKFKGCLYILIGPKTTPLIARHEWSFIREIWPTLVMSKPSEKLSIITLMSIISDAAHRFFPTIAIHVDVPDRCIVAAEKLMTNVPSIDKASIDLVGYDGKEALIMKSQNNLDTYNETVAVLLDACSNGNLHWRNYNLCLSFMRDLVHPDVKFNPEVIQFFMKGLIHDTIKIRKICIKVVLFIAVQNKPKYKKITIDPLSFSNTKSTEVLVPGVRPDNLWLMYDSKRFPKNQKDWDEPRFMHLPYCGYYSWPKVLEIYAPSAEQPCVVRDMNQMSEQHRECFNFFTDKNNVTTLFKYLSMEEKKGNDKFNVYRMFVFKYLFKTFEDKLYEIFLPHLELLVNDTQEQSQRAAAEIVCGILRGCKHWDYEKTENLWSTLIPIMRTAFNNMSAETASDWSATITMGLDGRDPNRYNWLIEFLMDDPLNEPTSLIGSNRLVLLTCALNVQAWRNVELKERMLDYFRPHLMHPFQNLRDKISITLTVVYSTNLVFPGQNYAVGPSVASFIEEVMPTMDKLYDITLKEAREHSIEDNTNNKMIVDDSLKNANEDREKYIRLYKTVAKFATGSIIRVNYPVLPEYYKLLPISCVLQNNDTDDELNIICANMIAILAHTLVLNACIPAAIEAIKSVFECPLWSARVVLAEYIPVLVFHNLPTLYHNKEWSAEILSITMKLLEDEQPEVRAKAGSILSGLLHCKFISDPEGLLEIFREKAKTRLHLKKARISNPKGTPNTLKIRHSGVLGLCAYISSHPYDVPAFLPSIFGDLSRHMNDPQPIPATIRRTLGDFKRTHHTNWETHKLQFTEDELSLLGELSIPPSYYA